MFACELRVVHEIPQIFRVFEHSGPVLPSEIWTTAVVIAALFSNQRPPAVRQRPPPHHRPNWPGQQARRGGQPDFAPRPYRADGPGYQDPIWPGRVSTGEATVPAERVKTPPLVAPQRPPRRIPLDSLEERRNEDAPIKFTWRRLLSRMTGIDLGLSKDQADELELRDRIRVSVGSAFPVAVLNLKGGVGKTAVVEALGSTFADARHDRVIAVDVDAGDLGDRHGSRNPLSVVDLLADRVTRYPDVRAHTCRNRSGLEVLGLPDYANSDWLIERDHVVKAFSILRNYYGVVLMDCSKALKSSVMKAVLLESRALVVVTNASVDAIKKTQTTLEWLANNGYHKRVESTVLAINHTERERPSALAARGLEQLSEQFTPERVVVLPFDRHVHEGREIGLDRLSKQSRRRYLEMAAALADMFPRRDVGNSAVSAP
jgi:MinD-like ATPase involved in chromosome partitioning or flagellar assembly